MTKKNIWGDAGIEPALAELLADPIFDTLMRADRVRVADLFAAIGRAQTATSGSEKG